MLYTQMHELKNILSLTDAQVEELKQVADRFPMMIGTYYLSLIDQTNPDDPIRKMAIPSLAELSKDGRFDTSGEADNTPIPGLQHKYRETALILVTDQCAMYCRHCFRKRLVGLASKEVASHWQEIVTYIQNHSEISNVILSGGDALMADDDALVQFLDALTQIDHIDLIRIATRTPVTFPERILQDTALLAQLAHFGKRKQLYVVTQFNHPHEVTAQSTAAIKALLHAGCIARNQMVLLKGVNDDPAVITSLFRALTGIGCMPYYVFQCRPVTGVQNHFQVTLWEGLEIVERAKASQNGMAKAFKYCMSHTTGKLEILGDSGSTDMLLRYHEAKDPSLYGKLLRVPLEKDACWLPDNFDASTVLL